MNRIKDVFKLLEEAGILSGLRDIFLEINNPHHRKNSIEELIAYARKEKGIVVGFKPFPDRLYGDSNEIGALKYILLNRSTSRLKQDFTMRHELGHHELGHFRKNQPEAISEFQAHTFAAFHFWQTKRWQMNESECEEYIRENPEAIIYPLASVVFFGGAIAAGLIWQAKDWISSMLTND